MIRCCCYFHTLFFKTPGIQGVSSCVRISTVSSSEVEVLSQDLRGSRPIGRSALSHNVQRIGSKGPLG